MSTSFDNITISFEEDETGEMEIPTGRARMEGWIQGMIGAKKVEIEVGVANRFSGIVENVRKKTFVITRLKTCRQEREIFTSDTERQHRRILMLSEVLLILKRAWLLSALGTIRFWCRDKDGSIRLMGIRKEFNNTVFVFEENPGNRDFIPKTIIVRFEKK
ncbi:MAG: hypothetical protein WCQ00_03510 [bacterium]